MSQRFELDAKDNKLLKAAEALLKKVASAPTTRPGRLVSVAKLLHVLSVLPRVTPDLTVSVSVSCPRRKFGEIEVFHWWGFKVEEGQLCIFSGGHFYQPSSGGDTFTAMVWRARPNKPSETEDNRETLWMVPDIPSFIEGVDSIDLASEGYSIEITDHDNPLLDLTGGEDIENGDRGDCADERSVADEDAEPETGMKLRNWSMTPADAAEVRLAARVNPGQVDAREPVYSHDIENCDHCGRPLTPCGLSGRGRVGSDLTWSNLCPKCFREQCMDIPFGDEQIYARQSDGRWRLVVGFGQKDAGDHSL